MSDKLTVYIPTIKDTQQHFNTLFKLHADVERYPGNTVIYNFSKCRALYPNAIAFLYGLARYLQSTSKDVYVDTGSLKAKIRDMLTQNGFIQKIEGKDYTETDALIPLREYKIKESEPTIDYLKNRWLNKSWINLSDKVRNAITGNVWEVYENAFEHAGSVIGMFSCGQRIGDRVKLAIIDFGSGIPHNVFSLLGSRSHTATAGQALRWAFQPGNTTKGGNRGMGLDLLKSFVKVNNGLLEVYSGGAHAIINTDREKYLCKRISFRGTLIYITFMCDDRYYCFASEEIPPVTGPLF